MENNLLKNIFKPPTLALRKRLIHRNYDPKDFTPLSWKDYFDERRDIKINEEDVFRVYLSGFKNKNLADNIPVLILIHGAGYSALSWSIFSKIIKNSCNCKIISIDLRGHGSTCTKDEQNLSIQTLVNDVVQIIIKIFSKDEKLKPTNELEEINYMPIDDVLEFPPLVLIGHSMGGAVAVNCSYKLAEIINIIAGVVVIDVVEGTAIEALKNMHAVLKERQPSFATINEAIEWCFKSGQTRNFESARISFPGQIKNKFTNQLAADYESCSNLNPEIEMESCLTICEKVKKNCIIEDEEEDQFKEFQRPINVLSSNDKKFVWRVDLAKSEPFWRGWFDNLSELFLNCPSAGRLLLLAGIDRLDKKLTIGQMQGKFQIQVLPHCGHAVHEDVPEMVAKLVTAYLVRNKLTTEKNPI